MSIHHIPAEVITTCDACGCRCTKANSTGSAMQEGKLTIKQHALDDHGIPCADVEAAKEQNAERRRTLGEEPE